MPRRLIAAVASVLAAVALAFAGAVPASADPQPDNTNAPSYWQTPDTGEVCANVSDPGGSTWTLPASPPAGSVWTKVIIKAGNTGTSVDAENNAYYSDPTYKYPADAPGTTWNQVADLQTTTFSHPSGKDISHVIYCWAPKPPTHVSGSASATDQTCPAGALVGGVITVVVTTGVDYTITGPSGAVPFDATTGKTGELPPGSYTVSVSAESGYVLDSASSIPLTIAPYGDDCAPPTEVSGSASASNQVCTEGQLVGGVITVVVTTGVEYTITGPSGLVPFDATTGKTGELPPGDYTVAVSADPGYSLTGASSIPLTIAPYDGGCGVQAEVVPTATVTDQTCQSIEDVQTLVGGVITVGTGPGVDYAITGPSGAVAIDALTHKTGLLPPGTYTVHPTAQTGFVLSDPSDIVLVVHPYDGDCGQLITHPLVDPSAASSNITCTTAGSYALSSDQADPAAVVWTVNGLTVAAGTHTVSAPGTYVVHAEPGTGFGFATGTISDWTFTFTEPGSCDLKTLALTGQNATPFLGAAVLLGLGGVVLMRASRRGRREA